jgi:hypothetical protein
MHLAITWFCSFDLGRQIDVKKVGEKLLSSGIAEAMLSYDERGMPLIEPKEMQELNNMLYLMGREDIVLFQEEYRRSCRFVRLKLRGFKATILDVDSEIEAYLMIHKAGFAVLSFWLFTDKGIKLEDIIKMEDPFSPFRAREIWTGFLDHIRKCKMVPEELIDKIGRGEEFTTSIEKIHNLYRSFVQSVIHDVDSCEELK